MEKIHPRDFDVLTLGEIRQLEMREIDFSLEGTWIHSCYLQLIAELKLHGIRIKPKVWVSDEWFSPDGSLGFAIPFYLFHPKLVRIHRMQGGGPEGFSPDTAIKIMRHECAHVLDNVYGLRRLRKRAKIFGRIGVPYPSAYRPIAESDQFVNHLPGHYAQAHPEEDWAETFAVWLGEANWRENYRGKGAEMKLLYVDELMKSLRGKAPIHRRCQRVDNLERSRMTIQEWYQAKGITPRQHDFFLADTEAMFSRVKGERALSKEIKKQKQRILSRVMERGRIDQYLAQALLEEFEKCSQKSRIKVKALSEKKQLQIADLLVARSREFQIKGLDRILM